LVSFVELRDGYPLKVSGHRILILTLLAATVAYLVSAWRIPMDPWTAQELVNARTMPLLYGSILLISLLLALLRNPRVEATDPGLLLRMFGVIAMVLIFLLVLPAVNLWFAMSGLLVALALWLGERRVLPVLAVASIVPLLGWLAIEVILGLHLPR
jgi:hypothetical protein